MRIAWLKEEDANTRFFPLLHVGERRNQNGIHRILGVDGDFGEDPEEIATSRICGGMWMLRKMGIGLWSEVFLNWFHLLILSCLPGRLHGMK